MENRKIIVSFYIVAGMLTWFLTRSSIQYLYLSFYKVSRIPGIQVGREALPVILGLVCFFVLLKHVHTNEVMDEVVSEVKKVTWPGREDVTRSTYVVMVCILIASLFLAAFDLLWGKAICYLLG